MFKTRITELFGIQHPILAGGLMWLSDARFVAGIVNAGGMGFITPRSFDTLGAYRDQLKLCRDLTQGQPFGVNLTLSSRNQNNEIVPRHIEVALEEGVRHFETVAAHPEPLFKAIHDSGGIVMHKASRIRHAQKAEALGADAVCLVGMEAGGHPGMNELPVSVMGAYAVDRLKVPLVLGGGIGSGRQIVAALALGADGVLMGTRFLACHEVWAHENYKNHLIGCDEESSTTAMRSLRDTWRVLANDNARTVQQMEAEGVRSYPEFGDRIKGTTTRDLCYRGGDVQQGMVSMGPAIGFATKRESVAEAMATLLADAATHLNRLKTLETPS
ncbi:nitronate monooxygenase [Rhizobacter sp. J219]|uniref:NAD(P)H-dependent flavin oxidoreductase n=1 Tax=Rhizobacter sp. J219 TaxID=2898430 RepID=UPI0021515FE0|nr:nitronate monooxygenase [Rhizobacter sp. J219]MCR5882846.1 nitronate monooxygenase [Rhizobacter sp. J219]